MLLYGVAILVLLIKKNAAVTSDVATTQAVRAKHERPFDKGELARLIHHVIAAADQSPENFDDEDDGKKPKLLKAAHLDYNYFDVLSADALKSGHKDIVLLKQNLVANEARAKPNTGYGVRIHLIKNPEVLEQYREDLKKRHLSTSSSSGYDDSLEYDRNIENFIRRNAVFRLGRLSEQTLLHDNSKLALRNGHDTGAENHRKKSREDEKVTHFERNYDDFKEKILVSFKDTKHDDYKARHDKGNQNRNKNYDEEPRKKDVWNDIAKNANKRNDKNENYENKANTKKEKYDDYDNLNSKASKSKESKSNNQDQKVDWEKPRKENSWDNWNSKSMEQGDTYKRGNNRDEKPKRDDDWLKQSSDWDKPKKTNDWDKPKKNNDWGKNNDDSWDQTKKRIKGIASFEDDKNDYSNKKYFNKEEKKKITNEWDRAIAKSESGRGTANKKPFVPQISNYYNPRPRIKDVPDVHGFKSFGRTSIPFVGKKGIYDDNN